MQTGMKTGRRAGRRPVPLRSDLLEPIPGANPSGANLCYDSVFDQIKEARTEDEENLPAGEWGAR